MNFPERRRFFLFPKQIWELSLFREEFMPLQQRLWGSWYLGKTTCNLHLTQLPQKGGKSVLSSKLEVWHVRDVLSPPGACVRHQCGTLSHFENKFRGQSCRACHFWSILFTCLSAIGPHFSLWWSSLQYIPEEILVALDASKTIRGVMSILLWVYECIS